MARRNLFQSTTPLRTRAIHLSAGEEITIDKREQASGCVQQTPFQEGLVDF